VNELTPNPNLPVRGVMAITKMSIWVRAVNPFTVAESSLRQFGRTERPGRAAQPHQPTQRRVCVMATKHIRITASLVVLTLVAGSAAQGNALPKQCRFGLTDFSPAGIAVCGQKMGQKIMAIFVGYFERATQSPRAGF
jgi:hypothetical protein